MDRYRVLATADAEEGAPDDGQESDARQVGVIYASSEREAERMLLKGIKDGKYPAHSTLIEDRRERQRKGNG